MPVNEALEATTPAQYVMEPLLARWLSMTQAGVEGSARGLRVLVATGLSWDMCNMEVNEQVFGQLEADRGRADDALDFKGAYKLGG